MNSAFEKNTFGKRLKSMLAVDFRRMFRSKFFYIVVASCLVIPILILVMVTLMDGTVSVDPQTGVETVTEGFDNAWQIIGTPASTEAEGTDPAAAMSITSMCNINMLYFLMAALVCVFISEDFRSGYSKNLFTVRAKKTDYVISKTLVCIAGCGCMLLAFFIGSVIGGVICNAMLDLPFNFEGFTAVELTFCMLSKLVLTAVFVPIYVAASVVAKQRTWLSMIISFAVGMLLFMMIPALTPINGTIVNVLICLIGGTVFSVGLGAISNLILKKTSLV